MAAEKDNKYAVGNSGGNPGYGKMAFIREQVEKYSELWWVKLEEMLNSDSADKVKFAMAEYNKLQAKMIPQDITSGGEPLKIGWQN